MHLIGFFIHSPINHTVLSWAQANDQRLEGLQSLEHWQRMARSYERGCFDGIFFADSAGVYDHFRGRTDETVKYGVCWPQHDPMPLIAAMAAATEQLGFAVTLSVAGVPPYLAVRTLSTLDYLSRGRLGWNIVTGHLRSEYRALGMDLVDHDERYDRAEEFMEICYRLWGAYKPGAIVMDRSNGIFADPSRIERVSFKGKYFACDAMPDILPSPQGRIVLFQAGSSGRGQRFAIAHADVVFGIQPGLEGMQRFMSQVAAAAAAAGRPAPPKVTFGLQAIVASTEAEALRQQDALAAAIPIEAALARLSGSLGVDFSTLDLDRPMEELATQASRGLMSAMSAMMGGRRMTLRELALRWGRSTGMPQIVGTPEQVADQLVALWQQSGCHGFNLTPTTTPDSIETFVDQVVPLLQRRGVFRTEYEGRTLRANLLAA